MLPSATTPKLLSAFSNRSMSMRSTALLKTSTEKMMRSTTFEMTSGFSCTVRTSRATVKARPTKLTTTHTRACGAAWAVGGVLVRENTKYAFTNVATTIIQPKMSEACPRSGGACGGRTLHSVIVSRVLI